MLKRLLQCLRDFFLGKAMISQKDTLLKINIQWTIEILTSFVERSLMYLQVWQPCQARVFEMDGLSGPCMIGLSVWLSTRMLGLIVYSDSCMFGPSIQLCSRFVWTIHPALVLLNEDLGKKTYIKTTNPSLLFIVHPNSQNKVWVLVHEATNCFFFQ